MVQTLIISLGGSLIAPKKIDIFFLKNFRKVILDYIKRGNRVIIICGGGNTARNYQRAVKIINPKISPKDLDWVGIAATKINAELVRNIFDDTTYQKVLENPTKLIKTKKRIIIGCGWQPGCSSDKDTVLAAKTFRSKTVINLSNITYVYNKDPREFKDAKPLKNISWKDFLKIVGNVWHPGAHVPFDPVASKLAQRYKLKLIVMKGSDLRNLKNFLQGRKFKGTVIE